MCLESSAPTEPDSEYDNTFVFDAKSRGAYYFGTIDDNTSLSEAEREEFIRAAGGREHPDCRREYFGERVRDPERVLIPEFDMARHCFKVDSPKWLRGYVGMDPGMTDMLALVFAYWHEEIGKLVITSSWSQYNAGTREVADAVRSIEQRLWGDVQFWNGKEFKANPYVRVSDTDKRIIHDLWNEHQLHFDAAEKNYGSLRSDDQAGLLSLRNGFRDNLIVVDPSAGPVLDHIVHGKWNERRSDWDRHDLYGHYDCVAALKYLWRRVEKNAVATPPEWVTDPTKVRLLHHVDNRTGQRANLPAATLAGLNRMYPKPAWRR
jgi:hypothetical protein